MKRNILRHYIDLTAGDLRSEPKYFFLESSQSESHVTGYNRENISHSNQVNITLKCH